jgi:hypothetical protein
LNFERFEETERIAVTEINESFVSEPKEQHSLLGNKTTFTPRPSGMEMDANRKCTYFVFLTWTNLNRITVVS